MDAENAFQTLGELFSLTGFSYRDIVRQWNYIEDIVGYREGHQNYQVFNDIRSKYYKDHFRETGYPAATGIGMISGGLVLEYIACKNDDIRSVPLDNPEQVPAYLYDQDCLEGLPIHEDKTTPKFERGRQLSIGKNEYVFISGTAAISGKKSVHPGNIERQTDLTLANIERLVSSKNLLKSKIPQGDLLFDYLRIYVKEINHYKPVESACRKKFAEVPAVFLVADICRKDLLVEVEGTMVLISK
jgi:enamine deaminase RidA (YjgF/YER057c/UK114 family)